MADHPSNKLYRGECETFAEAYRTYLDALNFEIRFFDGGWNDPDASTLRQSRDECNAAFKIYREEMEKANKLAAERIRQQQGAMYEIFADSIETGDFSILAF